MSRNNKQTSQGMTKLASKVLRNENSSATAKKLAGSAMAQFGTSKQTGKEVENLASRVLGSEKYSEVTKSLAGAVLSQANKER